MSKTVDAPALMEQLCALEGAPAGPPIVARDPVNEAMIRHWCEALGDANPVYTDPEAAARSVHGGIVAPPAMLQAWTMVGPGETRYPDAFGQGRVRVLLEEAGFTGIVATNCEQEYARYLRPGDRITCTEVIESVSEEKKTAMGSGHFVTLRITYTDERGEVVGTQRWRLLRYRPASSASQSPSVAAGRAPRPRPGINDDTAFFWEGVAQGRLLAQRCGGCGALRHPPRPGCPACGSLSWDPATLSGLGEVYSFVVYHHPPHPAFEVPYVVAVVALAEGVRMVSNIVGIAPSDVRIGTPVEVSFERVDGELVLPLFRPRGT